MSRYQGKAIQDPRSARRAANAKKTSPLRRPLRVLVAMLALGALAMVPWGEIRERVLVLDGIHVVGLRYLDQARVRERSGLQQGQDLLTLDLPRARQLVLLEPRIRSAKVRRVGLRSVEIPVEE